ncbi:MAG: helicase-related protein [Pirellulaceae bacterium]
MTFRVCCAALDLIEPILQRQGLEFVRLDGSVPQKDRQQLVQRFQTEAKCRLFITTNAGSTGLNLQAADTVINVDLPWNPAVLEQRIARAYRMGQKQPVQVYVLVTDGTIEENLLTTLAQKQDLALAALDASSELNEVQFEGGIEEMRNRLEVLLGAKPIAPVDESGRHAAHAEAERLAAQRDRVAAAAGEMLGTAFRLLSELTVQAAGAEAPASERLAADLKSRLTECIDWDGDGRPRLSVTLPNAQAVDNLARTLASLLVVDKTSG